MRHPEHPNLDPSVFRIESSPENSTETIMRNRLIHHLYRAERCLNGEPIHDAGNVELPSETRKSHYAESVKQIAEFKSSAIGCSIRVKYKSEREDDFLFNFRDVLKLDDGHFVIEFGLEESKYFPLNSLGQEIKIEFI